MSSWQLIFIQSKVNNGAYDGDRLFAQNWAWPKETWFQMRLRDLRRGNGNALSRHALETADEPACSAGVFSKAQA
jgi:hypothetical protein